MKKYNIDKYFGLCYEYLFASTYIKKLLFWLKLLTQFLVGKKWNGNKNNLALI